jgi:hypothetical protein
MYRNICYVPKEYMKSRIVIALTPSYNNPFIAIYSSKNK